MFNWRKGHAVTKAVDEYLAQAETCMHNWRQAFEIYLKDGPGGTFDELVEKTHIAESLSDDILSRIEEMLYEKSLVPESRGDIITLLDHLDRIPSKADSSLQIFRAQNLRIPKKIGAKIIHQVHMNHDCFMDLAKAVRVLFTDLAAVRPMIEQVDKKESAIDRLEYETVRLIFADPKLPPDQKILLSDLVVQIDKISDGSERVATTLMILSIKRVV